LGEEGGGGRRDLWFCFVLTINNEKNAVFALIVLGFGFFLSFTRSDFSSAVKDKARDERQMFD